MSVLRELDLGGWNLPLRDGLLLDVMLALFSKSVSLWDDLC